MELVDKLVVSLLDAQQTCSTRSFIQEFCMIELMIYVSNIFTQ